MRQSILLISFSILLFCTSITICLPAAAVLREHHESPGVVRYHVQNSLQDPQGMTWQVVLFPEPQSSNLKTKYHLRLVGFPGVAEFLHPQPLEIITNKGQVFKAADLITVSAPAPNVGEYDLTDVLSVLPQKGSLKLSTILKSQLANNHDAVRDLSISIPESTLIEWQWLIK